MKELKNEFKTGLDVLLADKFLQQKLTSGNKKIALLGHPASVNQNLQHSLDALFAKNIELSAAFGPQHGIFGDKQDNMMETQNFIDPKYKIPVFSLYGETRRLSAEMLDSFDILLVDLQDLGCRIYTFLTTLCYILQDCNQRTNKEVWILERPNPAGRIIEGMKLQSGWESFVGVDESLPMRHGLTLGEIALWYQQKYNLYSLKLEIVKMQNYQPKQSPYFGWVNRSWVNPSPNAASLNMARVYAGTVLLEGTNLSEGRGTTRPLECVAAPNLDVDAILQKMQQLNSQNKIDWLGGCDLRKCCFEPTFHKFKGEFCSGIFIHADNPLSYNHNKFKPYRLICLFLKALKLTHSQFEIWRDTNFAYEYEIGKYAIDVINGSQRLREWVENNETTLADFDEIATKEEQQWQEESKNFLLYY